VADDPADLRCELAQPLVVARLIRDVSEQVTQPLPGDAQAPPLLGAAKQDLGDRQRNQLGVGDPWASSCTGPGRQEIVDQHVKCDEKVVKVGEYEATVAAATTTVTLRCAGRDRRTVSGRELPRARVASRDRIDESRVFWDDAAVAGPQQFVGSLGGEGLRLRFAGGQGLVGHRGPQEPCEFAGDGDGRDG
jgi:hypothetical protein